MESDDSVARSVSARPDRLDKYVEKMNQSTSSEDSATKANIKDIVFDPRNRKRLLDGLNIVTPRLKRADLSL